MRKARPTAVLVRSDDVATEFSMALKPDSPLLLSVLPGEGSIFPNQAIRVQTIALGAARNLPDSKIRS
ncbi:hypothetical protein, partial [Mesorhizobium sp. M4B.F.Ca.ET.215.01.1.1]|uniref:hypothetical protein n=1 Tax=Mesorhizobium sp. M4B.F.Ca.ET.215.01.1.1 TaxID=2563956 RepID=UPI001AEE8B5B